MALCGCNDKMLAGLRLFGEGLWEAGKARAAADDLSIQLSFDRELTDMNELVSLLSQSSQSQEDLLGIAILSRFLYRNGQGLEDPQDAFAKGVDKTAERLKRMDDMFYEVLLPEAESRKEALQRLVAEMAA